MMMLNHFANPQAAWLLLLPLVVYFMFPAIKKTYGDALKVPFLADIKQIQSVSGKGISFKPAVFSAIKIFLLALVGLNGIGFVPSAVGWKTNTGKK